MKGVEAQAGTHYEVTFSSAAEQLKLHFHSAGHETGVTVEQDEARFSGSPVLPGELVPDRSTFPLHHRDARGSKPMLSSGWDRV